MILRMVKKDFIRNKATILTLFLFIFLSSLFASAGSFMAAELTGAVKYLFEKSEVPHLVQMNSGEIDKAAVSRFVSESRYVKEVQIVEMISMGSRNILFNGKKENGQNDVMDISLVRQNKDFDFLLTLDNSPVYVDKGKIAVPVYYMQKENLKKGDKIRIYDGDFGTDLIISDFIRDAQMNPAIIHSKRFVINDEDFHSIRTKAGKSEQLLEFQLDDISSLGEFRTEYSKAPFHLNGSVIDHSLFILLNSITDGITTVLCLSFTVLASIEEDYREIGTMKAIGIKNTDIKKIYAAKYGVISALGCASGYLLSVFLKDFLLSDMSLYMGKAPSGAAEYIFAAFTSLLIFFIIMLYFEKIQGNKYCRGIKNSNKG